MTNKRATCIHMVPGHVSIPELCCNSFPIVWQKGLAEDPDWQHMAQHDGHVVLTVCYVPSHCQSTPQLNPTDRSYKLVTLLYLVV